MSWIDINDIPDYSYDGIEIKVRNKKWYQRLWIVISNPFYYVIKGEIRY